MAARSPEGVDTATAAYTERLLRKQLPLWKRWARVQAPYRWNLRRLKPGFMLDIGCGIGRNLVHIDGHGVGVDHNPESVEICRRRGINAYVPSEFWRAHSRAAWQFDSLLAAHVLEHMAFGEALDFVARYVPLLRPGGRMILITPQERGFRREASHVEFMDFDALRRLNEALGLRVVKAFSFPFPRRPFGLLFPYNEFVVVSQRDGARPRSRA